MLQLGNLSGDLDAEMQGAISSGRALKAFESLVRAQGGDVVALGSLSGKAKTHALVAPISGTIRRVDAWSIGKACTQMGSGRLQLTDQIDPYVGISHLVKEGAGPCGGISRDYPLDSPDQTARKPTTFYGSLSHRTAMSKQAAGIILFRTYPTLEVLIVHPGGPFWKNKDVWSFPKGELELGEDPETAARREFAEETGLTLTHPLVYVGECKQASGKHSRFWASRTELTGQPTIVSNKVEITWPPHSQSTILIPEVDKGLFVDLATAKQKTAPFLIPIIERFEQLSNSGTL
jgi:predicted NUDIX family NTP pyrophosphohydrolase